MASVSLARARQPRRGTAAQQARLDKGMTQAQAIAALTRLALRHGVAPPSKETLKRRLSSWENNPVVPEPQYRMLLRELSGRTDAELGFNTDIIDTGDGHEDALTEIRARLARSQGVDGALLDELDQHTHRLRLLDRRFGAASVLDQITSHINLVRQLITHTVLSRHRRGLARILADASALAGWQALDTGAIMRAWLHFDLARSSGQEAGDAAVYAHALGEQSYALADVERYPDASALLEEAASFPSLPLLMRSWLAAAQAEMRAYLGDREAALHGFDQAEELLPADCDDPAMPYLALNITHLSRWRGHGLALLGGTGSNHLPHQRTGAAQPRICARRMRPACRLSPRHARQRGTSRSPQTRPDRKTARRADRLRAKPPPRHAFDQAPLTSRTRGIQQPNQRTGTGDLAPFDQTANIGQRHPAHHPVLYGVRSLPDLDGVPGKIDLVRGVHQPRHRLKRCEKPQILRAPTGLLHRLPTSGLLASFTIVDDATGRLPTP